MLPIVHDAAQKQVLLAVSPVLKPRSLQGQFRLVALDKDHTLLEGTTWYQNYFWPQMYWREWSDAIVHRIHMRVLEHVKAQAERQAIQTVTH